MRKKFTCMECNSIYWEKKNYRQDLTNVTAELNNDGYYIIKCDKGHEFITVCQELKFEILFDLGAIALIEGNTRSAVVNFASAFERFLEFCIEVFSYHNEIKQEDFLTIWKQLENHSERQLGAYYLMYLNTLKEAPIIIDSKQVNFRNKVIHKGYIPSIAETEKYGEYLFNYIRSILDQLKKDFDKTILIVIIKNMKRAHELAGEKKLKMVTISSPTILSLSSSMPKDFKTALEAIKSYKSMVYEPFGN